MSAVSPIDRASCGVILNDKRLESLKTVFDKWFGMLRRYSDETASIFDGKRECLYYESERTTVGSLCSAAWLAGGVALEEYPDDKVTVSGKGRVDLWISVDNMRFTIEAKQKWPSRIGSVSAKVLTEWINDAYNDTENDVDTKSVGCAVVFAVPEVPVKKGENLRESVQMFLDTAEGWVRETDNAASMAWWFDLEHPPEWSTGRMQNLYPGVLTLLKPLRAPSKI
jgi:hypothetical protein